MGRIGFNRCLTRRVNWLGLGETRAIELVESFGFQFCLEVALFWWDFPFAPTSMFMFISNFSHQNNMIEVLLLLLPISTTMYNLYVFLHGLDYGNRGFHQLFWMVLSFERPIIIQIGIPWIILWHGKDSEVTGDHGYTAALHHLTSQSC